MPNDVEYQELNQTFIKQVVGDPTTNELKERALTLLLRLIIIQMWLFRLFVIAL